MKRAIPFCIAFLVCGCGGGGGGSTQATNYSLSTPAVGAQRISNVTIVDNSNNTISMQNGLRLVVTSVNADGSFTYHEDDPASNTYIVNGTNYSVRPADIATNTFGQTKSITYTASNIKCAFSPNGGGPTYPIQIDSEWSVTWSETCGTSSPVLYVQTGKVVGVETITVPAGTFTVLHFTSTTTHTDSLGTTRAIKTDTYKRTNDLMTIKSETSYSYSGTLPTNGYPITRTEELQSAQ
jgi:hypothetical protein